MNCGNNPRRKLTAEERATIEDFSRYLEEKYAADHAPDTLTPERTEWLREYEQRNRPQTKTRREDPPASGT